MPVCLFQEVIVTTMAMTDEPKIIMDTIKKCAPIICQNMNRESIYPYLLQCSLLTGDESYHFMNTDKSPGESSSYLIELLERKDSDSAQIFYQCLQMETEHIGHSLIIKHLRNTALQGNFQALIKLHIYQIIFSDTSCKEKLEEESEKGVYTYVCQNK